MRYIKLSVGLLLALALTGCAAFQRVNPAAVAETPEQRAFAHYGTFVVFEETGANMIEDPAVSASIKSAIRAVDTRAKPVADGALRIATEVSRVRRELAAAEAEVAATEGDSRDAAQVRRDQLDARLVVLEQNLAAAITEFVPLIADMIAAIRGESVRLEILVVPSFVAA